MIALIRNNTITLAIVGSLALAAGAGFLASTALGLGTAGPPTKTTTVQVGAGATGPQGPAGPAGPPGPAGPAGTGGADECPTGSSFESVVLNAPGGHVEIWTCVKQ